MFEGLNRSGDRLRGFATMIFIVALSLFGFASLSALGQMSPVVPDPVTTPELMKYADLLGLSDQQKVGLLPAHDDYKERYKQFYDRDVVKLRDAVVDMAFRFQRNRFDIPPREELEGLVNQYTRLLNTGRSIDRSLFDTIAVNLTEDQLLQLQRAKTARELSVYRELVVRMAGEMNQGARVDLTVMLRQLKLPPEQIKAVDPILAEYEPALLSRSKDVFDAILKGVEVVLDTIDRLGIRGMTPEKMMEMAQDQATLLSVQTTFDEASKPFQAAGHEISELNHRTFKRLAAALDADSARRLRENYFERGYREAYTGPAEWQQFFRHAIKSKEVSDSQRADLQAQLDGFIAQEDAMVDSIAADLQKWREYRSFTQFQQRRSPELVQKIDEFKKRRESLATSAMETLRGMLGEELFAALDKTRKQGQAEVQVAGVEASNANVSVNVEVRDANSNEARDGARVTVSAPANVWELNYAPQPMSQADFKTLCTALRVDAEDQSVLSALYDEYRAKFDVMRLSPLPKGENDEKLSVSEEAKAQKARYQELLALDDHFFADATVVAVDANQQRSLKWLGEARKRSAANETAKAMAFIWNEGESIADPVAVLLQLPLEDSARQNLEPMIAQYQTQAEAMVNSRLEAARESRRAMTRMQTSGSRDAQAQEFAREKYTQANAELRKINRGLSKLNRQFFDDVQRQLSPNDAWEYRFAYYQVAYPEVYRDERSADRALEIVLSLPELSSQQRQTVTDINSEHRTAYLEICDRMIALMQDRPEQREDDFSKEAIDRYMELERTRFERSELNARTRMRLRLAIAPEIAQRLPELNQEW